MLKKDKIGIMITTYESGTPVLSHIFWGKTIDQALGYAHSHLESDIFFSGSFVGKMKWKGGTLILADETQIIGEAANAQEIHALLEHEAQNIHTRQVKAGFLYLIEQV